MFKTTLEKIKCVYCASDLRLNEYKTIENDVLSGELTCKKCKADFPILNGVAVIVKNIEDYLAAHVKGISRSVPDSEIPKKYHTSYIEAKSEIQIEHVEDDLESERINALYFMNHYLKAKDITTSQSTVIQDLIEKYWDNGPFQKIKKLTKQLNKSDIVEIGCGVGGLSRVFEKNSLSSYLGIDSSFSSIALARFMNCGASLNKEIKVPSDLLFGNNSVKIKPSLIVNNNIEFIVGDFESPPVHDSNFDLAIVLNAIDMMEDPGLLPKIQKKLIKKNGKIIHSCPYIWHEVVAKKLRRILPKNINSSAEAVKWLFEKEEFKMISEELDIPWLFFKHDRQLEIYSVHLFMAAL